MKENGKTVKCPVCGSANVIAEPMFDYVKTCMNDKCPFKAAHPKGLRKQWSTGVHN